MPLENLNKIRAKYPQYNDIPDNELASRLVTKYPQYQDILGDIASPQPGQPSQPTSTLGNLAQKASAIVSDLTPSMKGLTTPTPITQFNQGKEVLQAGQAADKNYPAENILPGVGATLGGIAGGAATLPSGAGVPFGATIGAGIGGQAGDMARQYVAALRGNPGVSKTPEEAVQGTLKTGAEMAGTELAGSTILKGLETLGVIPLFRKGMGKFVDFLTDSSKPVDNAVMRQTIAPHINAPSADTGDIKNFVKNILDKKGISITNPQTSATETLTPVQMSNFKDAGMSPADIESLARASQGMEGNISDIAKSIKPKLSSELQTPQVNDYKGLANIYQDLSKPNLTYGQLKQMQSTVGDMANFGSAERTGQEKIMGKVYNELGNKLDETASKGNFFDAHDFVQNEGRKYYQNRFLNNLLSDSREFTPFGPKTDYGKLASKLNTYSDEELANTFGDDSKYIQTLRDLANQGAKIEKGSIYTRVSAAGRPMATVRVGSIMDKYNAPENARAIFGRNLGSQEFNPFDAINTVNQTITPGLAAAFVENKKKGLAGQLNK